MTPHTDDRFSPPVTAGVWLVLAAIGWGLLYVAIVAFANVLRWALS